MCLTQFAAGESSRLTQPDYDQYVETRFGLGNFSGLVTEWGYLRQSNILLLRRMVPRVWDHQGEIDESSLTTRGVAWLIAGHMHHHLSIVEERCNLSIRRDSGSSSSEKNM